MGALERWLLDDGRIPFHNEYLTDVTLAQWRTIVRAQGGMDGANKWYRAVMRGYNTLDEECKYNLLSQSPFFQGLFRPDFAVSVVVDQTLLLSSFV